MIEISKESIKKFLGDFTGEQRIHNGNMNIPFLVYHRYLVENTDCAYPFLQFSLRVYVFPDDTIKRYIINETQWDGYRIHPFYEEELPKLSIEEEEKLLEICEEIEKEYARKYLPKHLLWF